MKYKERRVLAPRQSRQHRLFLPEHVVPGCLGQLLVMHVAQQLRRLGGPVPQAQLALLLGKALPVQLVSAPLVDIQ